MTDDAQSNAAPTNDSPPANRRRNLILRVGFLALLVAGLVLWTQQRKPRELSLEIDLTNVLPGDVREADVIVRRGGSLLTRKQINYGREGAPGLLAAQVHARPGDADVEVTLVYEKSAARQFRDHVDLREDRAARMVARQ